MTARLLSITTAPDYGATLVAHDSAVLVAGVGIEGDRHAGNVRQVTVVCTGEFEKAAAELGVEMDPVDSRRNLVVDLPELSRRHGAVIVIGDTELEVWRDCAPCELMDEVYGEGGRQALKAKAGVTAQVIKGGVIRVGDLVELKPARA